MRKQNTSKESIKGRNRQAGREKPPKNPFYSNVGASRQLQSLGLDVDDPELNKQDYLYDQSLESRMEESKAFRKQWKADEAELKELAKRKIVQKKMFPKPANPNLLTWLEKETIRFLHQQDPVEWNHEKLAESFPATPGVIHKVLRGRTITNPEKIAEYNAEVTSNWKLLAKGKLELEEGYQRHLASSSGSELPLTQRLLAEQDAVGRVEKITNKLPRPSVPGPWASIVADYNRKIEENKQESDPSIGCMFAPNSVPGSPEQGEVSPYSDTALLATDIDLAKEQPMDVATFKKTYLSDTDKKEEELDENPWRARYLAWVRAESRKEARATARVEKLQAEDVEVAQRKVTKWKRTDENTMSKVEDYLKQFERKLVPQTIKPEVDARYQEQQQPVRHKGMFEDSALQPRLKKIQSEQVEIPAELKAEGWSLFKVGSEVYDRQGNLLYRTPTI